MGIISKTVGLASDWGKKIVSNLSVDGGIEGLSKNVIKNVYATTSEAAKIAESAGVDSGVKSAMNGMYSAASSARGNVASGTKTGKQALVDMYEQAGRSRAGARSAAAFSVGKEYLTGGTRTQNITRAGAAAGAYMGVNLAGRALTGGSLGYNRKGERDIAGIPLF